MKPVELTHEFERDLFERGDGVRFCLPITAVNSTVLGYDVTHRSRLWRQLDWSRVRIDNGPHLLHPEDSQYIHVDAWLPSGGSAPPEKVAYRVRSKLQIGDKVRVKGYRKRATVCQIEVGGFWNGRWQWRYKAT